MTMRAADCAAGGNLPVELPSRVPGTHLPEFPARPVWVTADFPLLERVRAGLLCQQDGDGR